MRTAKWLIENRNKTGLSQKKLAQKIGVSIHTIENIEQEKRFGSAETWEKIEDFFNNNNEITLSYSNNELLNELKQDIEEFGEDHECILIYKVVNDYIFFTNYDFICEEMPFNPKKELLEGEKYIKTTFKYALEVLEQQNK